MPTPISAANVLLVEGNGDKGVVEQLWPNYQDTFTIIPKMGVDPLLDSIRLEVQVSGRRAVGILVDADEYPERRWQAIADRLKRADVNLPPTPDPNGTIVSSSPNVGVWMMPDNQSPGELEEFIESMIPSLDAVWPLSQSYVDGIPSNHRKFTNGKLLRAKVHAWLAARKEPRPIGTAIRAGDLDKSSQLAVVLVGWLDRLFN